MSTSCNPGLVIIVFAAIGGMAVAVPGGCLLGWALMKFIDKMDGRRP